MFDQSYEIVEKYDNSIFEAARKRSIFLTHLIGFLY
jgi:hypothetical protein